MLFTYLFWKFQTLQTIECAHLKGEMFLVQSYVNLNRKLKQNLRKKCKKCRKNMGRNPSIGVPIMGAILASVRQSNPMICILTRKQCQCYFMSSPPQWLCLCLSLSRVIGWLAWTSLPLANIMKGNQVTRRWTEWGTEWSNESFNYSDVLFSNE